MDDLPLKRLCRYVVELLLLVVPPFGSASVFISLAPSLARSRAIERGNSDSHNPVGAQLVGFQTGNNPSTS
jgi:hypothetical protein